MDNEFHVEHYPIIRIIQNGTHALFEQTKGISVCVPPILDNDNNKLLLLTSENGHYPKLSPPSLSLFVPLDNRSLEAYR